LADGCFLGWRWAWQGGVLVGYCGLGGVPTLAYKGQPKEGDV